MVLFVQARPWQRWDLPAIEELPLSGSARVDSLVVTGVPVALANELRGAIDWAPGRVWGPNQPGRVAKELESRFPCLLRVKPVRLWRRREVRFEALLRRPAGLVDPGSEAGPLFLGERGTVFRAPDGVFEEEGLARVDLSVMPAAGELGRLGRLLRAAKEPDALPSPMARMTFSPESDGWSAELEDGTRLQWGRLRWTGKKLRRLREVLADAAPRFEGGLTADLRHFEDGKILVKLGR